jgi:hypothetical protein
MHNLNRGIHVHGGAGEVVIVANTNDIRILELFVEQRIRVSAVAVVGGPVSLRSGRDQGSRRRSDELR